MNLVCVKFHVAILDFHIGFYPIFYSFVDLFLFFALSYSLFFELVDGDSITAESNEREKTCALVFVEMFPINE